MALRLGATIVLLTLLAAPGGATFDPARAFLTNAFQLSATDIEHLDGGQVVSRTLEVKNRREVATLGIVRIRTSPSTYVERLADITSFKRTPDVLQIGTFGSPPQLRDVASLNVDEGVLKRLRECRVEDCDVRLGADGIERIRREITGAHLTRHGTQAAWCGNCSSTMSPVTVRAERKRRWSTRIASRESMSAVNSPR